MVRKRRRRAGLFTRFFVTPIREAAREELGRPFKRQVKRTAVRGIQRVKGFFRRGRTEIPVQEAIKLDVLEMRRRRRL